LARIMIILIGIDSLKIIGPERDMMKSGEG